MSATFYWWLQNKIHKLAANAALTQAPPYTSRSSSWLESLKHTQSCLQSVLPVGGPFAILRDREMLGRVRPILTPPNNYPYVPALASTDFIQLKQLKKKYSLLLLYRRLLVEVKPGVKPLLKSSSAQFW